MAIEEHDYSIKNDNWSQLKEDLLNVQYDGGTVFEGLCDNIKNEKVYVFTARTQERQSKII